MTQLEGLDLTGTRVGDKGLADIEKLKELRQLRLGRTGVTDKALEEFRKKRPDVNLSRF
jgi:hypothetical protein